MNAANDNIQGSGRGRRPKTPEFIRWESLDTRGLTFEEAFASWGERDLYMQEDCRFGGTEKSLWHDGCILTFETYRAAKNGRLVQGPDVHGIALPDTIDADGGYARSWHTKWYWQYEPALARLEKRRARINQILQKDAA